MTFTTRARRISLDRRPLVMGIVNINDDSFCGDGTLDVTAALEQAAQQIAQGADIIDIGAESARTNRAAITEDEECARLQPFMQQWQTLLSRCTPHDEVQTWPPLLSVNTWRPKVIHHAITLGAEIINDISGLPTAENAALCAPTGTALIIMHSVGQPKVAHTHVTYQDVMQELNRFFTEKLTLVQEAGLRTEHIILDPGIDFAKQRDDNLTIYRELERLRHFGLPILLPVSRKTVIHHVLDQPDPTQRDPGTVASIVAGARRGAHILRVHNVPAAVQTVQMMHACMPSS
jgi:dihydropteroate synthase